MLNHLAYDTNILGVQAHSRTNLREKCESCIGVIPRIALSQIVKQCSNYEQVWT